MSEIDQFEVESKASYSGSYVDALFRGNIGNRFLVVSMASGSNEIRFAKSYAEYVGLSGSERNRKIGLAQRFNKFISANERLYDTLIPNIYNVYGLYDDPAVVAGQTDVTAFSVISDGGAATGKLLFTAFGTSASYSSGKIIGDTTWISSFPFQGKYKNVTRNTTHVFGKKNIFCSASEITANPVVSYTPTVNSAATKSLASIEFILPNTGIGTRASAPVHFTILNVTGAVSASSELFYGPFNDLFPPATDGTFENNNGTIFPAEDEIVKLVFGFGDGYQGTSIMNPVTSSKFIADNGSCNYFYFTNTLLRGWKYGLSSGFPVFNSCVFRTSRFGQYRDMLEQRAYTKFYDTLGILPNGTITGKQGSTQAAVNITFVSGSDAFVTASDPLNLNTRETGIYDFEAKVGVPYSDTQDTTT